MSVPDRTVLTVAANGSSLKDLDAVRGLERRGLDDVAALLHVDGEAGESSNRADLFPKMS